MIKVIAVEDMAQEYVKTLNSPANCWGEHIHKGTGLSSHLYMMKMRARFGHNATSRAIDTAITEQGNTA